MNYQISCHPVAVAAGYALTTPFNFLHRNACFRRLFLSPSVIGKILRVLAACFFYIALLALGLLTYGLALTGRLIMWCANRPLSPEKMDFNKTIVSHAGMKRSWKGSPPPSSDLDNVDKNIITQTAVQLNLDVVTQIVLQQLVVGGEFSHNTEYQRCVKGIALKLVGLSEAEKRTLLVNFVGYYACPPTWLQGVQAIYDSLYFDGQDIEQMILRFVSNYKLEILKGYVLGELGINQWHALTALKNEFGEEIGLPFTKADKGDYNYGYYGYKYLRENDGDARRSVSNIRRVFLERYENAENLINSVSLAIETSSNELIIREAIQRDLFDEENPEGIYEYVSASTQAQPAKVTRKGVICLLKKYGILLP